jgi:GTP cyclohydrolase II
MPFGTSCEATLPTDAGRIKILVIPEMIPFGKALSNGKARDCVVYLEHVVLRFPWFRPHDAVNIILTSDDLPSDLFCRPAGRLNRCLTTLARDRADNSVIVVTRMLTDQAVDLLTKSPVRSGVTNAGVDLGANVDEIVLTIRERLHISGPVRVKTCSPDTEVRMSVGTIAAAFTHSVHDEIASAEMPARAWNILFHGPGQKPLTKDDLPVILVHKSHNVLLRTAATGPVDGAPLVRVHSSCFTSHCGARNCDCRQQFTQALGLIAGHPSGGAMIHHQDEGRGAMLALKVRMINLKMSGLDTYQAMRAYGFRDDIRQYDFPALFLRQQFPDGVALVSGNPDKVSELERLGVKICDVQQVEIPDAHPEMAAYLEAKALRKLAMNSGAS